MTAGTMSVPLTRCRRCGTRESFCPQVCRACFSSDFEAENQPAIGTVISSTVIRRPPARFQADGPYAIVSLRLDSGPQVTGRLKDIETACAPGDRVHATSARGDVLLFERLTE